MTTETTGPAEWATCAGCYGHAAECALENWLDDKKLRTYIGDGKWQMHRDLTDAEWAEVAEWGHLLTEQGMALCAKHADY